MRPFALARAIPAACWLLVAAVGVRAGDEVDYRGQIKPLLKSHCYACHAALKQEGGLRVDTAALALKGGDSGPAVVAGKPEASPLIERVTASDASIRMPQEGKPLSAGQVDLLRRWIAAGAPAPEAEQPAADPKLHWSFQPPRRPAIPAARGQVANAVDCFLDAKLADRELAPLGPASPEVQLRRLYLDLIGLPPTRGQLHAFLADRSPDAYERAADRLLASPQYGERWARHWMDVWRYSDWYGRRAVPDVMNSYPQIWRWRDWIARSLAEGKGYDQMILEMLAADELWPGEPERHVATGFIVRNWFKWNYDTWMRDQVEHTGKAFLGLTFNCALCHDHKYDPISQEDYFRFRAIFEPLELRHDRVPGEADPGSFKKYVYAESYGPIATGRIRVFDEKLDAQTFMYRGGDQRNRFEGRPPVAPGVPAILGGAPFAIEPIDLPPQAYYPGLRAHVREEELVRCKAAVTKAEASVSKASAAHAAAEEASRGIKPFDESAAKTLAVAERTLAAAEATLAAARGDLSALAARIEADRARYESHSPQAQELATIAARLEREAKALAARAQVAAAALAASQAEAAPADDKRPGAIAAALKKLAEATEADAAAQAELAKVDGNYSPLGPVYPARSTGRRAALARWIASADNPLTARVAVNHVWRWHFGRPLVETTANFGASGKPPSHPELLDWLALELVENHWSPKRFSRKLVASEAYRRASDGGIQESNIPHSALRTPHLLDPENRWYWRAHVQRMEAEVVRDSVLAVAGELDQSVGGPEIDHAQGLSSRRRSLYFAHHGESKMELLELFDGASPTDCYERSTSTRPQQALALSNSELAREAARQLAARLHEPNIADEPFAQAAFEHVLSRSATPGELAAATGFLARQKAIVGEAEPQADSTLRSRASLIHVLLNHHDFVTIR
jgi:hypothetical protein